MYSHYFRTTNLFKTERAFTFADDCLLCQVNNKEAEYMLKQTRKYNLGVRTGWDNNFYAKRIQNLKGQTVIRIFHQGNPHRIAETIGEKAELLEKLLLISTILFLRKNSLVSKLGYINLDIENFDFLLSDNFKVKSRKISKQRYSPIVVDENFHRRYKKCSFQNIFDLCMKSSDISQKVQNSLNWLYESRIETNITVSIVKTAIALESLLIFNESESIASNLSERIAFLLTSSPQDRSTISKIIKRYYNVRSGIVHGNKKRLKYLKVELLDAIDRLTILVFLTIATNVKKWKTFESLKKWLENQKWDIPDDDIVHPYSKLYLTNAIALSGISKQNQEN